YDQSLDDDAERADADAGNDDREPQRQPRLRRLDADIGAEHEEFALRQVDHPHHAEDDGEAKADEDEDREGVAEQVEIAGEMLHRVLTPIRCGLHPAGAAGWPPLRREAWIRSSARTAWYRPGWRPDRTPAACPSAAAARTT